MIRENEVMSKVGLCKIVIICVLTSAALSLSHEAVKCHLCHKWGSL